MAARRLPTLRLCVRSDCGKLFHPWSHYAQVYCSQSCVTITRNRTRTKPPRVVVCAGCGVAFAARTSKQTYHDVHCARKYASTREKRPYAPIVEEALYNDRREARFAKAVHYVGEACAFNHAPIRYASSGTCVECEARRKGHRNLAVIVTPIYILRRDWQMGVVK